MKQSKSSVVFRFRRPAGAPKKAPSRAMSEALERLSETEEMRLFARTMKALNRVVVIEVFHSAEDGHPLLIHTSAVSKKRA